MSAPSVKFKYTKYSSTVLRPVITAEVRSGKHAVKYDLLVDSGADINVVNAELADQLGLKLETGVPASVIGPTGYPKDVFIHPIELRVGGQKIKTRAAFMEIDNPYGLAGQRGFFDAFRVAFDLRAEEIKLRPYHSEDL